MCTMLILNNQCVNSSTALVNTACEQFKISYTYKMTCIYTERYKTAQTKKRTAWEIGNSKTDKK